MFRLPGGTWLAGRGLSGKALAGVAGYALSCVAAALILLVAGVGYYAQKTVDSIGTSNVDTTGPSTGPMNILIMGLESRTYWNGTLIDHHLQYLLHTGDIGGEQTNTLILLHAGAPAHMATNVLTALGARGYQEGVAQTAATPDQPLTTVTYGAGAGPNASVIASYFGATATPSSSVPAGHVVVTLGGATLAVPAPLAGTQPKTSPSANTSAGTPSGTPSGGGNGRVIAVAPNAKYGIPCVY